MVLVFRINQFTSPSLVNSVCCIHNEKWLRLSHFFVKFILFFCPIFVANECISSGNGVN